MKKLFACAVLAVKINQCSFDKATLKAARMQLHLDRKTSESKRDSTVSSKALAVEIDLIKEKLSSLREKVPSEKVLLDITRSIQINAQNRAINDHVLFLKEQEIRNIQQINSR